MCNESDLGWPYNILGFTQVPSEVKDIKRAYARRLKKIDQSQELQKFQELREAYEHLVYLARNNYFLDDSEYTEQFTSHKDEDGSNRDSTMVVGEITDFEQSSEGDFDDGKEAQFLAIDWETVNGLIAQLSTSTPFETDKAKFARILKDPVFIDAEAMTALEASIFEYLEEKLVHPEDRLPFFKREVTRELIELIDEKFDWLTDYTTFSRKFYSADMMMPALVERRGTVKSKRNEPPEEKKAAKEKLVDIWKGSLRLLLYLGVYIVVLLVTVNLPYMFDGLAAPNVVLLIMRVIAAVLGIWVIFSMFLRILKSIELLSREAVRIAYYFFLLPLLKKFKT
ncbi:J domain-containing protein [Kiloniella sp.]|uniref:J domain-containing protein n=1 Tax=Kiloniella sp. TaxID=1938587 RepID=UPI003B01AC3B